MDTIVMKFGGSSVADNIRLNLVAEKIIELYKNHDKLRKLEENANQKYNQKPHQPFRWLLLKNQQKES